MFIVDDTDTWSLPCRNTRYGIKDTKVVLYVGNYWGAPGQSTRASSMCWRELTPCLYTGKSHQICKSTLMDTSSPRCGGLHSPQGLVIVRGRACLTPRPQYYRTCHATNTSCRVLDQHYCANIFLCGSAWFWFVWFLESTFVTKNGYLGLRQTNNS